MPAGDGILFPEAAPSAHLNSFTGTSLNFPSSYSSGCWYSLRPGQSELTAHATPSLPTIATC